MGIIFISAINALKVMVAMTAIDVEDIEKRDKMTQKLTCIVCPRGCEIEVVLNEGTVESISGNSCKRGEEYARNEVTAPMRQVTTTVAIEGGIYNRLPVILSDVIPKERMMDVCKALADVRVSAPVKRGDIVLANVCNLGVDVISSRSM